jgi:hypothetical protein
MRAHLQWLDWRPLARLRHKGHWLDYLDGMLDSHSIRRAGRSMASALPVQRTCYDWQSALSIFNANSAIKKPGAGRVR